MTKFALYDPPEVFQASKPDSEIGFIGHSLPHFRALGQTLRQALPSDYAHLAPHQADFSDYLKIHDPAYIAALEAMAADLPPQERPRLSAECQGFWYALDAYAYSLGGLYTALDQMRAGQLERAYCLSLGGHHAYRDWGHGYCLLNPLAVACRHAQGLGFQKILILDWDIHHGDGTQAIFAHDPDIFCLSIHSALDLYMGVAAGIRIGTTAAAAQVGHRNIPLLADSFEASIIGEMGLEGDFFRAEQSLPLVRQALDELPFAPDLICVFNGVDSHRDDCGGGITNWTNADFQTLTRWVLEAAARHHCPVLSVQGGGYKLPITIPAILSHLEVLASA
jgi:acetoin utilization deacetylase AcuC-like enzyme